MDISALIVTVALVCALPGIVPQRPPERLCPMSGGSWDTAILVGIAVFLFLELLTTGERGGRR